MSSPLSPGPLHPHPIRRRLWKFGVGLAIFILSLAVGNALLPAERAVGSKMLGHDFLAFYTAGTFINQNRTGDLYNLQAVNQFQHELGRQHSLEIGESYGPFWNPPFYALIFSPLARLPYPSAVATWILINVSCVAIALILLGRLLIASAPSDLADWKTWGLVPLLAFSAMPFIQSTSHAQNTGTSLLILTIAMLFWRKTAAHRASGEPAGIPAFAAGAIAGLLFYKPQLALVIAVILTLHLGPRALLGLSVTGLGLLLANVFLLPGTLADFLHQMPANIHRFQIEQTYIWERHATLKAFWRLLLQGRSPGEPLPITTLLTSLSVAAVGIPLLVAAFRARSRTVSPDALVAATIASMPLLMPFYFDYDLLLLLIPAVLLARSILLAPRQDRTPRFLLIAATALYLWLYFNPAIAPRTRFNLTVPLLAAFAGGLLVRALRAVPAVIRPSQPLPATLARAA